VDLRSHVGFGSASVIFEGHFLSLSVKLAGKAEISYFQNIFPVLFKNQNVLQFEVPMGDSLLVEVVDSSEYLSE